MNITLELLHGVAIVKNRGAIPLTDDPLTLSIFSKKYLRDDLFVTGEINGKSITFEIKDGIAVIPAALKEAGAMKLTVRKIINGEILQTWSAEPVLLREIDGKYEAIPQITELSEKVAKLTEAVAELKNIIINQEEF